MPWRPGCSATIRRSRSACAVRPDSACRPARHSGTAGHAAGCARAFLFGWAKPVPVNLERRRKPRHDMALVALAGPAANLGLGLAIASALPAAAENMGMEFRFAELLIPAPVNFVIDVVTTLAGVV